MKLWGIIFLFFSNIHNATAAWDLNDVSYLFPLPLASDAPGFLLQANSKGKHGELLPESLFKRLALVAGDRHANADVPIADLRVLGVRIDPCFHMQAIEKECHRQIRMVWQPLDHMGTDHISAADGPVHTFYDLTEDEFENLLKDLQALKAKNDAIFPWGLSTKGEALGVHPAFQYARTRADFSAGLKKVILSYIGSSRLVRITAVRRPSISPTWIFFGFDFPQGWSESARPVESKIPRINQTTQEFLNLVNYDQFTLLEGAIVPAMNQADDNLTSILEHKDSNVKDQKQYYQAAVLAVQKLDNPNVTNPNTMDCVHCHITAIVKEWTKPNRPDFYSALSESTPFKFKLGVGEEFNLKNTSNYNGNTMIIRAFGYYNAFPITSDRVIFESAEVAKALNAR